MLKSKYFATEHHQSSGRATGKIDILTEKEFNDGALEYDPMGNHSFHSFEKEMTCGEVSELLIEVSEEGFTYLK